MDKNKARKNVATTKKVYFAKRGPKGFDFLLQFNDKLSQYCS